MRSGEALGWSARRLVSRSLDKALFEAVAGSHDNWLEWTEGGDQELIEELIADGAKLNYYSKAGNNAFHEACSKGQLTSKSIDKVSHVSKRYKIAYSFRSRVSTFSKSVIPYLFGTRKTRAYFSMDMAILNIYFSYPDIIETFSKAD